MSQPIPVTVVTGFLGAGKTTLVNRWLADVARGDLAVIVNEHGDVGVDGALLAARAQTLIEISGGCVCCSTQAELVRALEGIASSVTPPKRILVETSGAASPAGVVRAIAGGGPRDAYVLDGIVTVVDGARASNLAEHDLAIEQVGYADIVVLSRSDQIDAARHADARNVVAAFNGAAWVVSAAHGQLAPSDSPSLDALLDGRRADFATVYLSHPKTVHQAYQSVSLSLDGAVDEERFADFMECAVARFAGRLFRTKGILAVEGMDERMIVQGVADLVEVTFGEPWGDAPRTCRFVLVGFGLDGDALAVAFAACVSRARA